MAEDEHRIYVTMASGIGRSIQISFFQKNGKMSLISSASIILLLIELYVVDGDGALE